MRMMDRAGLGFGKTGLMVVKASFVLCTLAGGGLGMEGIGIV